MPIPDDEISQVLARQKDAIAYVEAGIICAKAGDAKVVKELREYLNLISDQFKVPPLAPDSLSDAGVIDRAERLPDLFERFARTLTQRN